MLTATLWLHVLSMVGTFGLLLGVQFAIAPEQRDTVAVAKKSLMISNILIGIGLISGVAAYMLTIQAYRAGGEPMPTQYHSVIGGKFIVFFLVGTLLGIASVMAKKENFGTVSLLRWASMGLLAIASAAGIYLGV